MIFLLGSSCLSHCGAGKSTTKPGYHNAFRLNRASAGKWSKLPPRPANPQHHVPSADLPHTQPPRSGCCCRAPRQQPRRSHQHQTDTKPLRHWSSDLRASAKIRSSVGSVVPPPWVRRPPETRRPLPVCQDQPELRAQLLFPAAVQRQRESTSCRDGAEAAPKPTSREVSAPQRSGGTQQPTREFVRNYAQRLSTSLQITSCSRPSTQVVANLQVYFYLHKYFYNA